MGTNKALLRLGQKSVIEHVIERLAQLFESISVVANDVDAYTFLKVPIFVDLQPFTGPLMGLYTGITSCQVPWVLAAPCDTPFLEPRVLQVILAHPRTADVVAVEIDGQPQPLPALYSARCAEVAGTLLSSGSRALRDLLHSVEVSVVPEVTVRRVDPQLATFLDLDTVQDLRRARQSLP